MKGWSGEGIWKYVSPKNAKVHDWIASSAELQYDFFSQMGFFVSREKSRQIVNFGSNKPQQTASYIKRLNVLVFIENSCPQD